MLRPCLPSLVAVLGLALAAAPATAQSAAAQAELLFRDGRSLMDARRYAEACEAFAESQRLDPRSGTLLNLANCREKNGQLATAWSLYLEVQGLTRGATDANGAKMFDAAQKRGRALEGRVSKLVVAVPATSRRDGLTITRDGVPVGQPLWGRPSPVDGGTLVIEATAPGAESWRTTVVVAAEGDLETVEIPALVDAPFDPDRRRPAAPTGSAAATDANAAEEVPVERRRLELAGGLGVLFAMDCAFCSVGFAVNSSVLVPVVRTPNYMVSVGAYVSFATDSGENSLYLRTLAFAAAVRLARPLSSRLSLVGHAGLGMDWIDAGQEGTGIGSSELRFGTLVTGVGLEQEVAATLRAGAMVNYEALTALDGIRQFTVVFGGSTVF